MGVVYRARDQKTGRDVALKVLHPHLRRDAAYRERFQREALIAQALDSRHVVRVLDSCDDEETAVIVMEYVPGETLAERLAHGQLPLPQLFDIGIQIARALEEAHDKNVLHRDVKPQNVIIDSDGDAKVADFGIARAEEQSEATLTGGLLGAVHYMAPERFNHEADARSDIYSLGVVLYEMLSGQQPFGGPVNFATMRRIMEEEPDHLLSLRPEISAQLAALVHSCLAKDPAKRPRSAFEVRRTLEALREEDLRAVGLAGPDIRFRTPPRSTGRRPTALRIGLGALILGPVLGIVAALALLGAGESPASPEATTLRAVSMREGPGLEYAESREVAQGTVLSLLERSADGAWVRARLLDGSEGWLPVPAIAANKDIQALAVATFVPPTPQQPTAIGCEVRGSEPIASVLERCGGAGLEFNADCLRGQVCGARSDNGTTVLQVNDQTVAYIDEAGNLVIDRLAGTHTRQLTSHGNARQPAWSPDGRYIAYVYTEALDLSVPFLERRYAYQLRIIEVDRPGNEGVLAAATESELVPPWQQRRIVWPQWAPTGEAIYFAWAGRDNRASAIYSVAVPRFGGGVDIRALRIDAPRHEMFFPPSVRLVSVTPSSIDGRSSFFGGYSVLADGTLFLQHCRGEAQVSCGLGRWDGQNAQAILEVADGDIFALAGVGPDGVTAYGYFFSRDDEDWLIRVSLTGERQDLLRFDASRAGTPFFTRRLAAAPRDPRLLIETGEPRHLSLVNLEAEQEEVWRNGHSPVWFSIPPTSSRPLGLALLPTAPYATPTPAPTPPPAGSTGFLDLEVSIVPGSCARDHELRVVVRNIGTRPMVQEPLYLIVSSLQNFIRNAPVPFPATIQPGQAVEYGTGYIVQESVVVALDPYEVLRESRRDNNTARCNI